MRKPFIIIVFLLYICVGSVSAQSLPIEFEMSIFDNKPVKKRIIGWTKDYCPNVYGSCN